MEQEPRDSAPVAAMLLLIDRFGIDQVGEVLCDLDPNPPPEELLREIALEILGSDSGKVTKQ